MNLCALGAHGCQVVHKQLRPAACDKSPPTHPCGGLGVAFTLAIQRVIHTANARQHSLYFEFVSNSPLRRASGVASTMPSSASLRVATMMGPGGPSTLPPRRTTTWFG